MSNHIFKVGMEIEYDDVKNDINYKKHKYELACAQDIINSITLFGSERVIFSDDYDEDGEPRSMIIAEYNGDIVLLAYTWRGDVLRAISLRTANSKEREIFLKKTSHK